MITKFYSQRFPKIPNDEDPVISSQFPVVPNPYDTEDSGMQIHLRFLNDFAKGIFIDNYSDHVVYHYTLFQWKPFAVDADTGKWWESDSEIYPIYDRIVYSDKVYIRKYKRGIWRALDALHTLGCFPLEYLDNDWYNNTTNPHGLRLLFILDDLTGGQSMFPPETYKLAREITCASDNDCEQNFRNAIGALDAVYACSQRNTSNDATYIDWHKYIVPYLYEQNIDLWLRQKLTFKDLKQALQGCSTLWEELPLEYPDCSLNYDHNPASLPLFHTLLDLALKSLSKHFWLGPCTGVVGQEVCRHYFLEDVDPLIGTSSDNVRSELRSMKSMLEKWVSMQNISDVDCGRIHKTTCGEIYVKAGENCIIHTDLILFCLGCREFTLPEMNILRRPRQH